MCINRGVYTRRPSVRRTTTTIIKKQNGSSTVIQSVQSRVRFLRVRRARRSRETVQDRKSNLTFGLYFSGRFECRTTVVTVPVLCSTRFIYFSRSRSKRKERQPKKSGTIVDVFVLDDFRIFQ